MDVREAILTRLVDVCGDLEEGLTAYRNQLDLPETATPFIAVLDADETADDSDPVRVPLAPRRVTMTPEIYIVLSDKATGVGSALNALRAKLIHSVLTDEALLALTENGRSIRYDGMATGLARGRSMIGEMGVTFSFRYILRPDQLVETTT